MSTYSETYQRKLEHLTKRVSLVHLSENCSTVRMHYLKSYCRTLIGGYRNCTRLTRSEERKTKCCESPLPPPPPPYTHPTPPLILSPSAAASGAVVSAIGFALMVCSLWIIVDLVWCFILSSGNARNRENDAISWFKAQGEILKDLTAIFSMYLPPPPSPLPPIFSLLVPTAPILALSPTPSFPLIQLPFCLYAHVIDWFIKCMGQSWRFP